MSLRRRRSIFDLISEIEEELEREIEWVFAKIKDEEIRSGCVQPLYDVLETAEELIVTFDIPGATKEDIRLELSEDKLVLDAPCTTYPVPPSLRRHEFKRYRVEVQLPTEVDINNVKTRYKEGVLEVRIAKKAKGYRIKVL